jgi:hypothetical protein
MVRALLPSPDMHPVEAFRGRALVAFTAFEYRAPDIDPYNEFSISFPVTFGKRNIPGLSSLLMMFRRYFTAYVWQLPVTTERARAAGVELYGYPKFLADITFTTEGGMLACRLSENGRHILTLKGKRLRTSPEKVNRFKTYSVKDGVPLAANIYINPKEFAKSMIRAPPNSAGRARLRRPCGLRASRQAEFYQYMLSWSPSCSATETSWRLRRAASCNSTLKAAAQPACQHPGMAGGRGFHMSETA